MKILITIIATVLASILYRMGGSSYGTKWRDIGVSIIACLIVGLWGGYHWTLIICFGLMWGALSTYFKKKGESVRWHNWLICGLAYNVAFLPYVIAQGLWVGFGINALLLPLLVMGWSVLIGNAVVEELGRGALVILTIPLLFLFKRKDK